MAKILIVEDDRNLCTFLQDALSFENYQVEITNNGSDGLAFLRTYAYDVIILDWDVPGLSGLDICKEFRGRGGTTPILMLTGKGDLQEKETGLDSGADDYLTKPFHLKELAARVRALLRRTGSVKENVLTIGNLKLDPTTHQATIDGKEINLSPREFALLEFFMRFPEQVFTSEAILERVWTADSEATPEAVRTNIKRLRRKIESANASFTIHTVYGVGYKLAAGAAAAAD